MKKIEDVVGELSGLSTRHEKFQEIFETFKNNITYLSDDNFQVKGIRLINKSKDLTTISYLGRSYEFRFSSCIADQVFRGKITFYRTFGENTDAQEISCILYDGQSVADITPPEGEDPILLSSDSCCLNLVLNWLSGEINA